MSVCGNCNFLYYAFIALQSKQQKLINELTFSGMSSSIALNEMKKSNFLPLDFTDL